MKRLTEFNGETLSDNGLDIATHHCAALVVGSGAAGLAAALRLHEAGVSDVVLLTEDRLAGTSRNTGSDKQTYYKLTLAGDEPDSIGQMANTLFAGGCMDGDLARTEAAGSAACFHWLCEKGVPFPRNQYGEAVGYKTDHDPLCRASSAGPLTSRLMVESLEKALSVSDVCLFDHQQVIGLLTDPEQNSMLGVLSIETGLSSGRAAQPVHYSAVLSRQVVFAVGGPAMVYADSVYPGSQLGGTGLALAAGARAVNLTEWQYGLASIAPRWNVSGSYQQVLPRYLSTDLNGRDPRDFLEDAIPDEQKRLGLIFRKGYQWPFDVRRLNESSLVDLLVYQETAVLNRRVFLDFRSNPGGRPFDLARLDPETAGYLARTGAAAATPWQRLVQMNEPAFLLYRQNGVDLSRDLLEIRLCAQHHNGGLAVDQNWESNIRGLYPVGEACGTHGVSRPGGSALNSGQVGAWRAASRISAILASRVPYETADRPVVLAGQIRQHLALLQTAGPAGVMTRPDGGADLLRRWQDATERMSRYAGPFRSVGQLPDLCAAIRREWSESAALIQSAEPDQLTLAWRYRELLFIQRFMVEAMLDYADHGGSSRGSALYLVPDGILPAEGLPDYFRCRLSGPVLSEQVQEIELETPGDPDSSSVIRWRPVRPVPQPDDAFEHIWRAWREAAAGGK